MKGKMKARGRSQNGGRMARKRERRGGERERRVQATRAPASRMFVGRHIDRAGPLVESASCGEERKCARKWL